MKYQVSNGQQEFTVDESNLPKAEADGFAIMVRKGDDTQRVKASNLRSARDAGYEPLESSSVGEKAVGTLEGAANVLTSAGASLGGGLNYLATLAATRDPDAAKAVQSETENRLTYQPRTTYGKEGVENLERPFRKLGEKADQAGQVVTEKTGSPLLGAATSTALQTAPALLPGIPKGIRAGLRSAEPTIASVAGRIATQGEEAAAVRAAEEAPKQTKIQQARSIGLKLPPSEAGGAIGKVLEGAGGKVQTEMSLSRENAKVINRTAGKDVGLSERQPLTEANLERQKKKAFEAYDQVKKAGRITSDDAFKAELNKVRERTAQAEEDYPEDTNELIDKEIKKFDRESADSSSMLEKIKSLRERASRNMKAEDAEKFELGIAQKKIATAMENLIDRQVTAVNPDLIKNFRAARQQLAKIYNVEDALGPNGNLSAAVLARQLKRGVPLSGGLRTIAETYQEFPRVMRYVDNLGGHAPFSALDYLVGGVEAAAAPHKAASIVGALAARPIARGIIKSEAYQRRAIKPRETRPSITTRVARRIAGPRNTLSSLEDSSPSGMTLANDGQ